MGQIWDFQPIFHEDMGQIWDKSYSMIITAAMLLYLSHAVMIHRDRLIANIEGYHPVSMRFRLISHFDVVTINFFKHNLADVGRGMFEIQAIQYILSIISKIWDIWDIF